MATDLGPIMYLILGIIPGSLIGFLYRVNKSRHGEMETIKKMEYFIKEKKALEEELESKLRALEDLKSSRRNER